jgi:polar amino acid transport system substrate-binding protein
MPCAFILGDRTLKTSSNFQISKFSIFNVCRLACGVLAAVCVAALLGAPSAFSGPKELTVAVGLALPPYNIPETNSGIEMDIVREALQNKGYAIKAKYVPFARVRREFMNREVDAALTINPDSGIKAFYSDKHLVCQNVVVSLKKNNFKINTINDLKDKSVLAFQDATLYLGRDFASMAKQNAQYKEIAKQELQINLLYSNRVDAIVLDKNIFYHHRKHNDMVDTSQPIDIWQIFPPTPFSVAFVDEKVRDDFNEGLKQLRESGRYDEIVKKYITP